MSDLTVVTIKSLTHWSKGYDTEAGEKYSNGNKQCVTASKWFLEAKVMFSQTSAIVL